MLKGKLARAIQIMKIRKALKESADFETLLALKKVINEEIKKRRKSHKCL